MERKITKLEHCLTEVEVTFSNEEWKGAQKRVFDKYAKQVSVPGFRKGKAPSNLVKDKVNEAQLMNDSINDLLPSAYKTILDEDKIQPFAQPQVEVKDVTNDTLVVVFKITTRPEVELGDYKNLKIGHEEIKVSEEEIANSLKTIQEENATLVTKEKEASLGDSVIIDFLGKIDGVPFENGAGNNYELALGSHSFIPGFEEQCVGHKSGDEFVINVKFPENYMKDLAGKDATFDIKVHEVKEKVLPELNEELVKELNIEGVDTLEKLKERKTNELTKQKTDAERNSYLAKVYDTIEKNSKFDIPEIVIKEETEARKKNFEQSLKSQGGFTLEQYLSITGTKIEDFENQLKEDSVKMVTREAILNEVMKKEDIRVSDADLEFEFAKLADMYKMKIEDVKKNLQDRLNEFRFNVAIKRAEDFLFNNNN